ncbi:hypothetical protein [Lamprobacter modestohalophilus]|uniref:hypothetical protein n=1 Tax=Lamprobacter modestohalophilus TaxID=1064514 RepID=UPI00190531BF|nr:hypothetical protein [Lamprobacter modestohalophilus]
MSRIPNAGNYRDRLPPDRARPPRRTGRSRHQPNHRQAHHQRHQRALSPGVKRALIGAGVAGVIYLLWGGWGIFFALLLLAAILFARHALRI